MDQMAALGSSEAERRARLSSIAHDLRSPLLTIRMGCEVLERGKLDDDLQDIVAHMKMGVVQLQRMIDNLVEFGRWSAGVKSVECRMTAIGPILKAAATACRSAADERQQTIQSPDDDASVWADPDRLRLVLINLLINAVQYSPEGSRVEVASAVSEDPAELRLTVRDQGPGIPAEQMEEIFRPFVTSPVDGGSKPGFGIGLPLSRYLLEQMGARLEVQSQTGHGTTVTVRLRTRPGA